MIEFTPADAPGPGPDWEGSAEAATPLTAALVLGIGIPDRHGARVRGILLGTEPDEHCDADGLLTYTWNREGAWIALMVRPDGFSRASARIGKITHTVDGEVVDGGRAIERP